MLGDTPSPGVPTRPDWTHPGQGLELYSQLTWQTGSVDRMLNSFVVSLSDHERLTRFGSVQPVEGRDRAYARKVGAVRELPLRVSILSGFPLDGEESHARRQPIIGKADPVCVIR